MPHRPADVAWTDAGVPVSARFDDPYFSMAGGAAETQHVFLDGNGLPGRYAPGFHIAELGFGTGLNLLVAWAAWLRAGHDGPLRFTSFEAYPMRPADMRRALAAFDQFGDLAGQLCDAWESGTHLCTPSLDAEIIVGDARETLPRWTSRADAWFLDGFAPARNPELWQPALLAEVAAHTVPGGTLASYTAAGHVRRALTGAGLIVARAPGFGRKRHMTKASRPKDGETIKASRPNGIDAMNADRPAAPGGSK